MPAAQLICAAIETCLNQLISLDPAAAKRGRALQGKQISLTLSESPWPLLFQIHPQSPLTIQVIEKQPEHQTDCDITLSIATLTDLRDSSQVTRLIKQDKLSLQGDVQVAQAFSQLLGQLEIDWEEQLARRTDDVFAHQAFSTAKQLAGHVARLSTSLHSMLKDTALEEKPIAAHPVAIAHFSDQVNELSADSERLLARLERLERQAVSQKER